MKRAICVLTCLMMASCLPIPVRNSDSPTLSGSVFKSSSVAVGVNVCVRATGHEKPLCTLTDSQGAFRLKALKSTEMAMLMGDRISRYSLTFAEGDGTTVVGFNGGFMGGDSHSLVLACDLSYPGGDGSHEVHYCSVKAP